MRSLLLAVFQHSMHMCIVRPLYSRLRWLTWANVAPRSTTIRRSHTHIVPYAYARTRSVTVAARWEPSAAHLLHAHAWTTRYVYVKDVCAWLSTQTHEPKCVVHVCWTNESARVSSTSRIQHDSLTFDKTRAHTHVLVNVCVCESTMFSSAVNASCIAIQN